MEEKGFRKLRKPLAGRGAPRDSVVLTKDGSIRLTSFKSQIKDRKHVELYFNEAEKTLAIKPIYEQTLDSYQILKTGGTLTVKPRSILKGFADLKSRKPKAKWSNELDAVLVYMGEEQ